MSRPVVRNPQGAVLGVDWRRVPGMGLVSVPGRVPARDVFPGDTVRLGGQDVVVLTARAALGYQGTTLTRVVVRTPGGAEIVHEADMDQLVDVVAVGAFEP